MPRPSLRSLVDEERMWPLVDFPWSGSVLLVSFNAVNRDVLDIRPLFTIRFRFQLLTVKEADNETR